MILAFVPTSDVGTIALMGLTPNDIELLAAGESTPLIEFEDAMQRGIPLPKFMKMFATRDAEHFAEQMQQIFDNAGLEYDANKFKPLDEIEKIYERDEDDR